MLPLKIIIFISLITFKFQSLNEQLDKVKAQLQEELNNVSGLQAKVSELEVCDLYALDAVIHWYMRGGYLVEVVP